MRWWGRVEAPNGRVLLHTKCCVTQVLVRTHTYTLRIREDARLPQAVCLVLGCVCGFRCHRVLGGQQFHQLLHVRRFWWLYVLEERGTLTVLVCLSACTSTLIASQCNCQRREHPSHPLLDGGDLHWESSPGASEGHLTRTPAHNA